ncbi:unnamed protein product [Merluccius merluccius]
MVASWFPSLAGEQHQAERTAPVPVETSSWDSVDQAVGRAMSGPQGSAESMETNAAGDNRVVFWQMARL